MKLKWFATTMSVLLYGWTGAPAFAAQEVPIHFFSGYRDGAGSDVPALLVQPNGTLYGVDTSGGKYNTPNSFPIRAGEVFKLSRPAGATTWTKSSLYSFSGVQDGYAPFGKLVAGPQGSLYGTTEGGGDSDDGNCEPQYDGCGTVFQLMPPVEPGSPWTKIILHSFSVNAGEGRSPSGLVIDAAGNLYGTTGNNSSMSPGFDPTVFELHKPVGAGEWTLEVLHSFRGLEGTHLSDDLLMDGNGNLFGSTPDGGIYGHGTVFQLTPNATGWSYQALHDFQGAPNDGDAPNGGLRGEAGDIWGTTLAGGVHNAGTIFELGHDSLGSPTYTIQYTFSGGADGGSPLAGLFEADDGSYWGTASRGGFIDPTYCFGSSGCGVIFKLARTFGRYHPVYVYSVASNFSGAGNMDGSSPWTSLGADQNGSLYGVTQDGGYRDNPEGTIFQLANAVSVLPTATPTFTPAAGTYTEAQSVAIADTTPGAIIYYTTDTTNPTQNSTIYSSPITVSSSKQIKAIAYAPGYTKSSIAAARYTIELPAAAPTFSPKGGTYKGSVAVSMSDTTPGAKIYYTTDGTTPTTSSSLYAGPSITVTKTEQIKAIAVATGFTKSPVATVKYTITSP